jgi:acyl transferase domain-containing protein
MQEREIDVPDRAIAVIGMAGRFPGARSLQQFWTNLRDGVLGIAFFDEEEIAGLPRASRPARHVPAGAVLEDVDLFDAAFFNISPREAELLDPQRRLFLQCAWEAFESAGYDPFAYEGAIGVYAGASASSYLPPELDLQGHASRSFQALLANDKDYLPTHLAYKLNLRGPCVGIQTACSTSLVAVHMACMSLLDRECDMALAGGVTVRLPQKTGYSYEDDFILSPDGHCRAFDARARGVLFGNGVGVVILKRLEEAIEDGDPIRAVILGSAVNNDGSLKVGFTAPSEVGQAQVIAEALGIAGVDARTIQYIEAHGTATPLGDAIEISALKQVFGAHVKERRAIAIGALKSSVGHLESAAGVAGLIKTVLALEHRTIPGNVGFETPNPELGIESSPFYVSATTHDWKAGRTPRRAGVSSFGIGGTNAHVVLEEAPQRSVAVKAPEGRDALLPLSARSRAALEALARSYRTFLRETPVGDGERLGDILYTASVRRRHHEHRLALLGRSKEELSEALDAFLSSQPYPGAICGQVPKDEKPNVVFVFPGQGSQWVGMGRSLLEQEPVFRAAIEACDRAIQREAGFSVLAELRADEARSRLGEIDVVQPVLFAIEVGLAALWRSWGIEPAAVVGHSLGEVAAAHVAGALSLGDAAAVICRRSRLLRTQSGNGAGGAFDGGGGEGAAGV